MRKTFLIARREYLAFIRTVGFWLSLVTAPLIFACIIAVPMLIRQTEPIEVINVAILDVSGGQLEAPLRDLVRHQEEGGAAAGLADRFGQAMAREDQVRLVPLPAGLSPSMGLKAAEAKIPEVLAAPGTTATSILVAYDDGEKLHFHIWSTEKQRDKLADRLVWDLHGLQQDKMAVMHGVDPQLARDMRAARADIISLTPQVAPKGGEDDFAVTARENGPRLLGALMGYIAWMSIFSSSMILLGGVIEEKASKVLEVLLASVSTESLLVGKVLGVASVLATVAAIWGVAGMAAFSQVAPMLPHDLIKALVAGLAPMFTPDRIALLAVYFCGGYLMFGVTFAAIGAFCETQKDAQAVMGPIMIVLMIPMLSMQAALISPDSPLIRWLSYVPIFTPFLMPVRLSEPLPLWEIVVTLAGMIVTAMFMIAVGRRAFKQGALTGGKLSWGLLARIAAKRSA